MRHAATRATQEKARETGARELAYVTRQMGVEQGMGSAARGTLASLARLSWFAPFGMAFAQRFVNRALAQVTRYFTDETIRSATLASVHRLIDAGTKGVIGHSLGYVVAYETAHRINQPIPLLVTLGSPLGLQTIIYARLRSQPPCFPCSVQRWVNISDRDDFIAADLRGLFVEPTGAIFESGYTVDNGAEPHNAHYKRASPCLGAP